MLTSGRGVDKDVAIALSVFAEVNEHLRNTEQKQLAISAAYLGLVAVVMALLTDGTQRLLEASTAKVIAYLTLSAAGLATYLLQCWYRMWKEHYIATSARIMTELEAATEILPIWMRKPNEAEKARRRRSPKVDNTLIYFSAALNAVLVALAAAHISVLLPGIVALPLIGLLAASYLSLVALVSSLAKRAESGLDA